MKELLKIFAEDNTIDLPGNNPPKPMQFENGGDLTATIINIINIVIGFLGLVAVIVIIIGGINYMTSSGEASKVKKAKDTILYGVIGLVVCILAFAIVNFVIANIVVQN